MIIITVDNISKEIAIEGNVSFFLNNGERKAASTGYQLKAHSSQLAARGSQLEAHSSQLESHGYQLIPIFKYLRSMKPTAIKSERIITSSGMLEGVVLIQEGKIVEIARTIPGGEFTFIDVGKDVIMPGVIDPHVHINDPGRAEWEGFDTATRAALAGGITCLVDMPLNSSPVTITPAAYDQKLLASKNKLHTNCGFWGGIVPGNEKQIELMAEKGVLGFKAFLTHSGIDEFPNVTAEDLKKAMPLIAKTGLPLLVHCELITPIPGNPKGNPNSYISYLESRPGKWEDDAIAMMIRLCEDTGCRTHIVHLSSANSINQIGEAKMKGLPLTVETAQHYLFFSAEQIKDGQPAFKCAPPIRDYQNNERLWEALKSGIIDFVASDHSPAPPEMKNTGDLMSAWGGISSIQFALPVLWTAARKHSCRLVDTAKWLCENPAKLAGVQNTKGKIQKGYDADFVIWRPEDEFVVSSDIIRHRHKITPYIGERLVGIVQQTWLNGEKVFDNGKFLHLNRGSVIRL
jgi:allantoinase